MKNLLLILALFVVGCSEYGSYTECNLKERTKFTKALSHEDEIALFRFCIEFRDSGEVVVP